MDYYFVILNINKLQLVIRILKKTMSLEVMSSLGISKRLKILRIKNGLCIPIDTNVFYMNEKKKSRLPLCSLSILVLNLVGTRCYTIKQASYLSVRMPSAKFSQLKAKEGILQYEVNNSSIVRYKYLRKSLLHLRMTIICRQRENPEIIIQHIFADIGGTRRVYNMFYYLVEKDKRVTRRPYPRLLVYNRRLKSMYFNGCL